MILPILLISLVAAGSGATLALLAGQGLLLALLAYSLSGMTAIGLTVLCLLAGQSLRRMTLLRGGAPTLHASPGRDGRSLS